MLPSAAPASPRLAKVFLFDQSSVMVVTVAVKSFLDC